MDLSRAGRAASLTISESPVARGYRALLEQVDRWFETARCDHPGVIPCRSGCTACCDGPFDISVADALLLREGLAGLSTVDRRDVLDRAAVLMNLYRAAEPDWNPPFAIASLGDEAFDALAERHSDEPCPLLDDAGNCRVYHNRPLVCRIMGLGMRSGDRVIENGCPIQDQFPGYRDFMPREFGLDQFEEEETAWLEAAALELLGDPRQAGYETTIAAAIWLIADSR